MATIVKNEDDLNTLLDEDLITEDYALEILGLKNIADFRKFSRSFMKLSKIVKGIEDGKANLSHTHDDPDIISLDASKLKGTIDIARLPASALERCVVVADDTARFKLTKSQVQNGDSVKVTSPDNLMYIVVDDNKLNSADGYVAYSAAVKWETIKDKPETFPPSTHNHDGKTITALTGYAKSSAIAGISPSDSLLVALGKLEKALDGKAASSHGNHVPNPQSANNKIFLRNDNTWQPITPANIGAEPAFSKNTGFNKPFGTTSNTVLEGAKLAEILGLTYGGSLNTSSAKTVNYAYYDRTTKKVYKCIKATSINYADATYFTAISNNDLLVKLQNLNNIPYIIQGNFTSFKNTKSLKLMKNRKTYMLSITNINRDAVTGFFYETSPTSNKDVVEGTLVYDGEDSNYRYYHITSSQSDNAIIIIQ